MVNGWFKHSGVHTLRGFNSRFVLKEPDSVRFHHDLIVCLESDSIVVPFSLGTGFLWVEVFQFWFKHITCDFLPSSIHSVLLFYIDSLRTRNDEITWYEISTLRKSTKRTNLVPHLRFPYRYLFKKIPSEKYAFVENWDLLGWSPRSMGGCNRFLVNREQVDFIMSNRSESGSSSRNRDYTLNGLRIQSVHISDIFWHLTCYSFQLWNLKNNSDFLKASNNVSITLIIL